MQERKGNIFLITPEVATSASGESAEKVNIKRSKVCRFLLWVGLMKTSTYDKDGETHEKDSYNYGVIFALIFLYVTVIGGFIVLAIFGSLYFLEMRENQRTTDTWKQKQFYDNWQGAQKQCTENAERLEGLIRFNQQKGQEVPPQFLDIKQCGATITNELQKGEH